METSQWIACGLIPAVIAVVACVLAGRVSFAPLFLGLGWTLAVFAGLIGYRYTSGDESTLWWPDDFWQRGYWGMFAAAGIMGVLGPRWDSGSSTDSEPSTDSGPRSDSSFRWIVAAVIVMASAAIALPGGEGWDDTLPLHRAWMLLLAASGLISMWSMDRMASTSPGAASPDRWLPLVVLATLAGPMFVGVTTYSALAAWTTSAISATAICVLFAGLGRLKAGVGIVYPAAIFCITMIAAGRFYSYEDHPWWTYAGILWISPAVAFGDRLVIAKSSPIRIATAAAIAIGMIFWTVAWQFIAAAE